MCSIVNQHVIHKQLPNEQKLHILKLCAGPSIKKSNCHYIEGS